MRPQLQISRCGTKHALRAADWFIRNDGSVIQSVHYNPGDNRQQFQLSGNGKNEAFGFRTMRSRVSVSSITPIRDIHGRRVGLVARRGRSTDLLPHIARPRIQSCSKLRKRSPTTLLTNFRKTACLGTTFPMKELSIAIAILRRQQSLPEDYFSWQRLRQTPLRPKRIEARPSASLTR